MPELLDIHWEDYTRTHPIGHHLVFSIMGDGGITYPIKPRSRDYSQTFCDFCLEVVAPGASLAVFKEVRAKIMCPGKAAWWIDGPFGACRICQIKLGIRPGDHAVELANVRRLFKRNCPGEAEFYGPG